MTTPIRCLLDQEPRAFGHGCLISRFCHDAGKCLALPKPELTFRCGDCYGQGFNIKAEFYPISYPSKNWDSLPQPTGSLEYKPCQRCGATGRVTAEQALSSALDTQTMKSERNR